MINVKQCLDQKPQVVISVRSDDMVVAALKLMRDNRVRAVLVIDDDRLVGIVSQGDCAIKVLLPGLDAASTCVRDVMTPDPVTVKPEDPLEACMGLISKRGFRHLPVVKGDKIIGVVSIGDIVKENVRHMGQQIGFLETYIKGHGA